MKRWIVVPLLLVPLLASAAGFWDGNAALQRGDANFESGLFAASNSFPAGTQITIQNQDTGKSATATITGRIEGQSGILVLVSPKTADALGLEQGTLGRVRVTVPGRADSASSAQPGDQTVSSDPDVNPAAAYGRPDTVVAAAQGTPSEETLPSATPLTTAQVDATPAASPEAPAQEQPDSPQQTTTTAPGTTTASATPETSSPSDADNAAIISAAKSRSPQKQVFQPPREDQKFVYQKPATVPAQAAQSVAPTITGVDGEQGVSPGAPPASNVDLADVVAPEESRAKEIVGAGSAAPPPAQESPQVALASPDVSPEEQAVQPQEPVQTEVTGPAAVPPAGQEQPKLALLPPEAPASAQETANNTQATKPQSAARPLKSGPPGTFFLQLAAYGTEKNARELAAKLTPTYPTIVQAPSSPNSSVFKVVIGPLNRAESGTLLTWFRYRGFPDAFVKQE